jgi:transcriptional regulator with XRE-family HTH domain
MHHIFAYDKSYTTIFFSDMARGSNTRYTHARNCTEEVALPNENEETGLAAMVRRGRKAQNLTLTDLAQRSGISASTLSKIERGKLSPTYDNLVKLSRGLGVSVSRLFDTPGGAGPQSAASVMRYNEGSDLATPNYLHKYLHTGRDSRSMTPILVEVRARVIDEFGPLVSHPGQEFTYVLNGTVEIHLQGSDPVRLEAGESIFFNSTVPHAYLAASSIPCRILTVCTDHDQEDIRRIYGERGGVLEVAANMTAR